MVADLEVLGDLATPWAIRVAATLRVADHIAAGRGDLRDLAAATDCDRDALGRLIRHLVGKGIFEEPEPGHFALNEAAQPLLGGARDWLDLDLDGVGGRMAGVWSGLLSAVKTGSSAYAEVFGRGFWDDLAANPRVAASFDAMMGPAGHGTPDAEVLLNDDWEHVRVVVDVGGGTGSHLAAILKARPDARGILVDLPRTIARADLGEIAGRVELVGQSFFDPLPRGGDLYLLKNLLADWPDAEAAALLQRCAEALRPNGRLVILGGVHPDDPRGAPPDLLMLVLVGGKERTLSELTELALAAGLRVAASGELKSGKFAVELTAAQ